MTPALLTTIGEALYGPRWQSDLARDLGVADRTVRHWLTGRNRMPDDAVEDMRKLCEARGRAIKKLLPQIAAN